MFPRRSNYEIAPSPTFEIAFRCFNIPSFFFCLGCSESVCLVIGMKISYSFSFSFQTVQFYESPPLPTPPLALRYHSCHLPHPHSRQSCSARPTRIFHPGNMLYLQRRGPSRRHHQLKLNLYKADVYVFVPRSRNVYLLHCMCLSPSLCHRSHANLTIDDWAWD